MEVEVKLFNLLRQNAPGGRNVFPVQLPSGASLEALLEQLKIPATVQWTVLVNGRRVGGKTRLSPHDTVVLMSPIEGG